MICVRVAFVKSINYLLICFVSCFFLFVTITVVSGNYVHPGCWGRHGTDGEREEHTISDCMRCVESGKIILCH